MADNNKKIMIIDDNEDIVTMIKLMLEMKGFSVIVKMNINGLEDLIRETMPNLIIMDMLLSSADGRNICKSFKNNKMLASIPLLMISAHPNAKEECLNAGADMFLAKPFDVKDFFTTVEKSLQIRRE